MRVVATKACWARARPFQKQIDVSVACHQALPWRASISSCRRAKHAARRTVASATVTPDAAASASPEDDDDFPPPGPQLTEEQLQEQLQLLRGAKPVDDALYIATYLGISVAAGVAGVLVHTPLLKLTAAALALKSGDGDSTFETSFFGLLSIVYGLFTGQTFLFLYERQVSIVQELFGEVFALELLVQRSFVACQEAGMRKRLAQATRQYITEELYNCTDMESPFSQFSAYMRLLFLVEEMQAQGLDVRGLVYACQTLADAQSRRSAVAAQILPMVHWVFMHAMEVIFVAVFLLFDAAELFGEGSAGGAATGVPGERSLLFGSLLSLLILTGQVLHDLSNPFAGMYSFASALDDRMAFLARQLVKLETRPETYVPRSVTVLKNLRMVDEGAMAVAASATPDELHTDMLAQKEEQQAKNKRHRRRMRGVSPLLHHGHS